MLFLLELILAFVLGLYLGTYYHCKPFMDRAECYIRSKFPPEREGERGGDHRHSQK